MQKTIHVGLTGGIASGKSTVSQIFANIGVPIIDADKIAKALTTKNQQGFNLIVQHFTSDILNQAGDLDRAKLKQLIFTNSQAKQKLESLLHPLIHQKIYQAAEQYQHQPYILFDIPLLAEQIQHYSFKKIIVIDISKKLQLERLLKRDNMDKILAEKILKAQASRQQRLNIATEIINNNGTLVALKAQVLEIDKKFKHHAS